MTNFRTISAAAARLGASASTQALNTPAPAPAPNASQQQDDTVDVVTLTDAQAAVDNARAEGLAAGAAAEITRMNAVMSSDAGKADPAMAAWMLTNNPSASAQSISERMATMPKNTPAAAAETPAPNAETPTTPLTVPLDQTPKMNVGADANAGAVEPKVDANAFWDGHTTAHAQGAAPREIAPGLPATGN